MAINKQSFDAQVRKLSANVGRGLEVGAPVKVTKYQQASPVLLAPFKQQPRVVVRRTRVKRQLGLP
jgi:hypothetical protein